VWRAFGTLGRDGYSRWGPSGGLFDRIVRNVPITIPKRHLSRNSLDARRSIMNLLWIFIFLEIRGAIRICMYSSARILSFSDSIDRDFGQS